MREEQKRGARFLDETDLLLKYMKQNPICFLQFFYLQLNNEITIFSVCSRFKIMYLQCHLSSLKRVQHYFKTLESSKEKKLAAREN